MATSYVKRLDEGAEWDAQQLFSSAEKLGGTAIGSPTTGSLSLPLRGGEGDVKARYSVEPDRVVVRVETVELDDGSVSDEELDKLVAELLSAPDETPEPDERVVEVEQAPPTPPAKKRAERGPEFYLKIGAGAGAATLLLGSGVAVSGGTKGKSGRSKLRLFAGVTLAAAGASVATGALAALALIRRGRRAKAQQ